jgi:glutathionylspermidine synthase
MWAESFGPELVGRTAMFMEPVWKMLWSNKAFLVLLWELFEGHPLLLPAGFSAEGLGGRYAEKPIFGREGANVRLVEGGEVVAAHEGPWGSQPVVYQGLHPEVVFEGHHPVIGSWVIGGEPGGIGVREDRGRITSNGSRFTPHLF